MVAALVAAGLLAPLLMPGKAPAEETRQRTAARDGPAAAPPETDLPQTEPSPAPLTKPETGKPGLVTNMFFETNLRQALSDIATQTGTVIVPDMLVQGIVTCELKDVPLEKALEIVLAGGGYVYKKMDGYYLVGSPDPKSPSFQTLSVTEVLKLSYIKAEDAQNLLPEPLAALVKADKSTNEVTVMAPQAVCERILGDLKKADKPPRHVMLDARIVVIERVDLLNLGIQWTWPQVRAGTFSSAAFHGGGLRPKWPWGIEIGYTPGAEFTNSLILTLNLLAQNDEATLIASPQVMAQDGKEAEIKVNIEEYFQIVTEGYYYRASLEKIETGTVLKITPRISENGDITLEMSTEVSDVVARGEDNLPVVTRRSAASTVRIEDGGTAAIAGLMDNRTRLNKSRAPGLADIPLVGDLFRNTNSRKSSRQVAVFVTARLVPEQGPRPAVRAPGPGPVELVGDEFRAALADSLARLRGREGQ